MHTPGSNGGRCAGHYLKRSYVLNHIVEHQALGVFTPQNKRADTRRGGVLSLVGIEWKNLGMFNRSGQFLKWRLLDLVVLLFCVLGDVSGFSAGAGSQSCVNLMPLHSTHQGQEGPVPYVVELTKHTYQPNEQILVRLRGCAKNAFKGFLIEPRPAENPAQTLLIGNFLQYSQQPPYKYACGSIHMLPFISSVIFLDPRFRSSLLPSPWIHRLVLDISRSYIELSDRTTFLSNYSTFWVGGNSVVVYDMAGQQFSQKRLSELLSPVDPICIPPTAPSSENSTTSTNTSTTPQSITKPISITTTQTPKTEVISTRKTTPTSTKPTTISATTVTTQLPNTTLSIRLETTKELLPQTNATQAMTSQFTSSQPPTTTPTRSTTPVSPIHQAPTTQSRPAIASTTSASAPWKPALLKKDPAVAWSRSATTTAVAPSARLSLLETQGRVCGFCHQVGHWSDERRFVDVNGVVI
ncbi:hypothetical protein ScPMuIL_005516 [Solemya velum]